MRYFNIFNFLTCVAAIFITCFTKDFNILKSIMCGLIIGEGYSIYLSTKMCNHIKLQDKVKTSIKPIIKPN